MATSSSGRRLPVEKPSQHHEQQQQNQPPLKCPRCDSSNTKFCYYNNYSLSQPRHFCKSCKRYWTRGGTLRNVPVGGGCRKNKRVKRPSAAISTTVSAAVAQRAVVDISATGSMAHVNPIFSDMGGIPYPSLHSTVDVPPHLPSALGIGFSSPGLMLVKHGHGDDNYVQDLVYSAPGLSGGYSSDEIRCIDASTIAQILGFAAPITTTMSTVPTTMTSLLATTLQQQKFFGDDLKDIQAPGDFKNLSTFQHLQAAGDTEEELAAKEVKAEGLTVPEWSIGYQKQMELPNPLSHNWNIFSSIGTCHDPANTGSSIPSLI